jgi:hypothetical protein
MVNIAYWRCGKRLYFLFLSSEVEAFGMKESQALRSPKPQPDGASSGNRCSFVQHFC